LVVALEQTEAVEWSEVANARLKDFHSYKHGTVLLQLALLMDTNEKLALLGQ
jgi:hypothetical protein